MRKKSKKHPMEMTDEEALQHLFHPKIVTAVRQHLEEQAKPKPKRARRKPSRSE